MKSDKIIIFYSFFVSLVLTVVGVLSAKNASQLINGMIFLPLVFYFGINIFHFPAKTVKTVPIRRPRPVPEKPVETVEPRTLVPM